MRSESMASFYLSLCIFKIALPLLLSLCIIFRPCVLSGIYLLLYFVLPMIPVPTPYTMTKSSGIYLKILLSVSVITATAQIIFQIVLFSFPPYAHDLKDCEQLDQILRHVGFIRLDGVNPISAITWLAPEIIMLISSIVVFIACKKITSEAGPIEGGGKVIKEKPKRKLARIVIAVGKYIVLTSLCIAAILRPSVPGGIYFLVFLSAMTWWACCKKLEKKFGILLRCLMVLVLVHIVVLFVYQMPYPQSLLNKNDPYARYFGLTQLMSVNCKDPRNFIWSPDEEWASFLNPLLLLWLYYVLCLESKLLLMSEVKSDTSKSGETTPLISGASPSRAYGASTSRKPVTILQDSTGSVVVSQEHPDDIPMEELADEAEDESPTLFDNIVYGVEYIILLGVRSSYIFTNIIMMAWSITFPSWQGFALLLTANILWMVPNQRQAMLRFSPFLVCFAWFLLLSTYIFSMNLTNEELPQTVDDIDLGIIGFHKNNHLPCKNLFIKCLFTAMFWITLKQHMKEREEARQTSALADMVAPLQVTVGTAAGVAKEECKTNKTMDIIGREIKRTLTKFWIWVVAITLFVVAITGQRMTVFRIVYMALFLLFLLTFQLSYKLWRKLMLVFWIVVILFSMSMLVLVYTYQFKNIREYWTTYLHLTEQQQLDIGLEYYGPKQLFIRLATPTFFVIIIAIQIHYFHKEFMILSAPRLYQPTVSFSDGSSVQGGTEPVSEKTDLDMSTKFDISELGNMSKAQFKQRLMYRIKQLYELVDLTFLFFELQFPSIIMVVASLMFAYDKCAMYILLIPVFVISLLSGRRASNIFIYIGSVCVAGILLCRMVYQINDIDHNQFDVNCGEVNKTWNNAEWLGFQKVQDNHSLGDLLLWNILYIFAVTLMSVVHIRQRNYIYTDPKHEKAKRFMFPGMKRSDADKNLTNCIKYLFNFGFYKFGVEVCLIAMITLIAIRLDLYAIFYAVWLCVFVSLQRSTLAKVWGVFFFIIAVIIPVQYFMLIGLPPALCTSLPWDSNQILQIWSYLFNFEYHLSAEKLLTDCLLVILVSRQAIVFQIESSTAQRQYSGGSNDSILHHADETNFINPVPDFITYCRSYLDIAKRGFFLSWMWITLAIMFLAGTNRVSVFSIGYLIGSFVFLWQGADIYLHPIPKILRSWNLLIGYNVTVILTKTILQIGGCIYIETLRSNACWFIQLMAIGCANKDLQIPTSESDTCYVPVQYIGLVWDGLLFAFLLVQRRIFNSFNFFHIINETKATTILASRGAELIEELRHKRITEQQEGEKRVLEKIKLKMERIKASQQKIHGEHYKDSSNHHVDGIFPGSRPTYKIREPNSHGTAVRSGDYYMFDEIEDEELELIEEPKETSEEDEEDEEEKEAVLGRTPTLMEVGMHVRLIDPKEIKEEPQPGTSKDEDDEISELSEPKEYTTGQKILHYIAFAWILFQSCCLTLTMYFNKYSKDYRYILRVLNKEKKLLKERTKYNVGLRLGTGQVWRPTGSYATLLRESNLHGSPTTLFEDFDNVEMSTADQPPLFKLILSLWYIILSHSHILCYFMIFLNQIKSATFLSLPLPLLVLFWGTLTVPRPSKTFWVTIIAYTEVIVLIKCLFQFEIIFWNKSQNISPLFPPRIIGIEKKDNYALWDLLLLLIVFFHRFLLKCLGLWKTTFIPAVGISDGDYKISGNELQAIEDEATLPSSIALTGSDPHLHSKSLNLRKGTDLEKLVEETDEGNEDDNGDDIKKAPNNDVVCIQTMKVRPYANFVATVRIGCVRYQGAMQSFFTELLDPSSRIAADVYSYMFLCDFFNFFVILIGYSSFGPYVGAGNVSEYLEENRVPVLFLLMLIVQFLLIIVDRAIFLRKFIFGKIVFQFSQVIFLHIWLFIIYPLITDRVFNSVLAPQIYYMVKCFYLLLSAYQIRSGYPTRVLGNFICRGYNYFNLFLFKGFMAIPFLFELRMVMDWMWTDTSMNIFDWMKMEDIFAHIFVVKCNRYCEAEFPQPRGEKKPTIVKYLMGGAGLILIIAIIWFPLVFFALGNAVGTSNTPYSATIELRLGPYEPIYRMTVQSNSVNSFTDADFDRMNELYEDNKNALTFIANYQPSDIAALKFNTNSAVIWSISPPDRQRMISELNSSIPMIISFEYFVSHKSNTKEDSGTIREEVTVPMFSAEKRQQLLDMLLGNESIKPIPINYLLPKFIKVTNKGTAKPISQLMNEIVDPSDRSFRDVTIARHFIPSPTNGVKSEWWQVMEISEGENYDKILKFLPYADTGSLLIYTFNEKLFPSTLNFITAGGIIGVYTTIVLVAGRLLRTLFTGVCFKIMFEDLPNADRMLQLCYDIYLVRETRDFTLEEDLFAKLIFLFRSPETLIKWTRPKEEVNNEDDEDGDDSSRK